ncbi:1-deoxy-D-xylulose-5-phosphate reductoisomerase [Alistipes sp. ZOR0009]|jgi:1-deoxy-D-xylulose-5-phosphate reductoisomerase|uniref:1-deoxy-D-xylulose-5-phosphate reductoisomerase n=1 Tax=Alistipes sp. ZOR0009 TaxID=1339253 RepID=UPI000648F568|nr:1-deoxy-D-xylulose-5-phosphate reductoisomerase [Alistipes sp. ZOR0009]
MSKKGIAILGSTGSIGTQALEVVEANPDLFEVEVLTANNSVELLVQQAIKFQPNAVVIGNEAKYQQVADALSSYPIKVYAGSKAIEQVVEMDTIDTVLTAMVGYSGLMPTINAIKSKKKIALANKETLVVAGELVMGLADEYRVPIIPVDSEHSAIFQCLVGEMSPIEKILLTASGGPFLHTHIDELKNVTVDDALKHPNWSMGAKITIDSASMMNKGFEVIEAKWLFDVKPEQIEVVVHPQSIVHSMVQFQDSSIKAQMGLPDMKLPIQYAFTFPQRLHTDFKRLDFRDYQTLTFLEPDINKFRNLGFAFEAMRRGGNMACILNAANEVVVDAFLKRKVGFLQMSDIIEQVMQKATFIEKPTLADYCDSDAECRQIAISLIQ